MADMSTFMNNLKVFEGILHIFLDFNGQKRHTVIE
jgi:hypothetical protein